MSILRNLIVVAPIALALVAAQSGPKPFDEKSEVAQARKEIDARYVVLNKALWEADTATLEDLLGDSFWVQYAEYGREDSDDADDLSDFLSAVEEGSAPYAIQKSFSDSSTKIDRKVTSFTVGRTIALESLTETHVQKFKDTEGAYGEAGKERTMEVKVTWTDMWGYEVRDGAEDEKPNWYLTYRECTGAEIKVDGKPIGRDDDGKLTRMTR